MVERVSAVFDDRRDAEDAIDELRDEGMSDSQLSVITKHTDLGEAAGEERTSEAEAKQKGKNAAAGAGEGLLAGAGVGAIFGLAAAMIPGIGPFITAGWLASALGATAGGAVSGAIVGGSAGVIAGALAGALAKAGYSPEEAEYYGSAVERGGTMVAVDIKNDMLSAQTVREIFRDHGGRIADMDEEREYRQRKAA